MFISYYYVCMDFPGFVLSSGISKALYYYVITLILLAHTGLEFYTYYIHSTTIMYIC
jgi:hypothetical protein